MQPISIQELYTLHTDLPKNAVILDVRTPDEYAAGHIPGAKNISHESIAAHAENLKSFDQIYIYCRSGGRAHFAAHALHAAGVEKLAVVLEGGMPDWAMSGYPVQK